MNSKSVAQPKFIILEGTDRSGKDSMQDAIDRETRYKHMIMDRGPIGFMAYCDIYNKSDDLWDSYALMEESLLKIPNLLVIYLTASTDELVRRCHATNHEVLDFDKHKKIYELYFNSSYLEKITVDTTEKHVDEIVKELVEKGIL